MRDWRWSTQRLRGFELEEAMTEEDNLREVVAEEDMVYIWMQSTLRQTF